MKKFSKRKALPPSNIEIERVNQAFQAVTRKLDRFETICAKNNSPLKSLHFTNKPQHEFSRCRVVYRKRS